MFTELIGYAAAAIGTILMVPQAIKSYRSKRVQDLSLLTIIFYFLNCLLWLIYGVLLGSKPLVICNAIGLGISIFQLIFKLKY